MSKETELLPCPFCGGDVEEKHRHNFNAVACTTCHTTVPQSGIGYGDAGKLCNRRAADRELRQGDAQMPVVAWRKYDGQDFEYNTVDEFSGGRTGGSALVKLADAQAALTAQAVEIEGLRRDAERYRKDALRAATVAFGLVASSHPKELPQDAGDLAGWLDANVLADFSDDEKPEELFIYIIRAAIAREAAK